MAAASATSRKRKQIKICILDRLAKGERATKLATEFGIGNTMVTDLKKNEAKIRLFASSMESLSVSSKQRKTMGFAEDEEVDEALYLGMFKKGVKKYQLLGQSYGKKLKCFTNNFMATAIPRHFKQAPAGSGGSVSDMGSDSFPYKEKSFQLMWRLPPFEVNGR